MSDTDDSIPGQGAAGVSGGGIDSGTNDENKGDAGAEKVSHELLDIIKDYGLLFQGMASMTGIMPASVQRNPLVFEATNDISKLMQEEGGTLFQLHPANWDGISHEDIRNPATELVLKADIYCQNPLLALIHIVGLEDDKIRNLPLDTQEKLLDEFKKYKLLFSGSQNSSEQRARYSALEAQCNLTVNQLAENAAELGRTRENLRTVESALHQQTLDLKMIERGYKDAYRELEKTKKGFDGLTKKDEISAQLIYALQLGCTTAASQLKEAEDRVGILKFENEMQREEYKTQIKEYAARIELRTSQVIGLRGQIADMHKQIEEESQKYLEDSLEALKRSLENSIDARQKETDEHERLYASLNEVMRGLEREVEAERKLRQTIEANYAKLEAGFSQTQNDLKHNITETETKIAGLEEELQRSKDEYQLIGDRLGSKEKECELRGKRINELVGSYDDLDNNLTEAEADRTYWMERHDGAEDECERAEAKLRSKEKECELRGKRINELVESHNVLDDGLAEAEADRTYWMGEHGIVVHEYGRLEDECKRIEDEGRFWKNEHDKAMGKCEIAEAKHSQYVQLTDEARALLQKELEDSKDKCRTIEDALRNAQDEYGRQERLAKMVTDSYNKLNDKFASLKESHEELNSRYWQLDQHKMQLKEDYALAALEHNKLSAQIKDMDEEAARIKTVYEERLSIARLSREEVSEEFAGKVVRMAKEAKQTAERAKGLYEELTQKKEENAGLQKEKEDLKAEFNRYRSDKYNKRFSGSHMAVSAALAFLLGVGAQYLAITRPLDIVNLGSGPGMTYKSEPTKTQAEYHAKPAENAAPKPATAADLLTEPSAAQILYAAVPAAVQPATPAAYSATPARQDYKKSSSSQNQENKGSGSQKKTLADKQNKKEEDKTLAAKCQQIIKEFTAAIKSTYKDNSADCVEYGNNLAGNNPACKEGINKALNNCYQ